MEKPEAQLFPLLTTTHYLNRIPVCFPLSLAQGVLAPQESSHLDAQGRGAERKKEQMRQPSSNILTVSHVLTQEHTLGPDPVWSCEWKRVSSRQENVSQLATAHPQPSIKLVHMMSIRCSPPGPSPIHPCLCPLGPTITSLWTSSEQAQRPWDFYFTIGLRISFSFWNFSSTNIYWAPICVPAVCLTWRQTGADHQNSSGEGSSVLYFVPALSDMWPPVMCPQST